MSYLSFESEHKSEKKPIFAERNAEFVYKKSL